MSGSRPALGVRLTSRPAPAVRPARPRPPRLTLTRLEDRAVPAFFGILDATSQYLTTNASYTADLDLEHTVTQAQWGTGSDGAFTWVSRGSYDRRRTDRGSHPGFAGLAEVTAEGSYELEVTGRAVGGQTVLDRFEFRDTGAFDHQQDDGGVDQYGNPWESHRTITADWETAIVGRYTDGVLTGGSWAYTADFYVYRSVENAYGSGWSSERHTHDQAGSGGAGATISFDGTYSTASSSGPPYFSSWSYPGDLVQALSYFAGSQPLDTTWHADDPQAVSYNYGSTATARVELAQAGGHTGFGQPDATQFTYREDNNWTDRRWEVSETDGLVEYPPYTPYGAVETSSGRFERDEATTAALAWRADGDVTNGEMRANFARNEDAWVWADNRAYGQVTLTGVPEGNLDYRYRTTTRLDTVRDLPTFSAAVTGRYEVDHFVPAGSSYQFRQQLDHQASFGGSRDGAGFYEEFGEKREDEWRTTLGAAPGATGPMAGDGSVLEPAFNRMTIGGSTPVFLYGGSVEYAFFIGVLGDPAGMTWAGKSRTRQVLPDTPRSDTTDLLAKYAVLTELDRQAPTPPATGTAPFDPGVTMMVVLGEYVSLAEAQRREVTERKYEGFTRLDVQFRGKVDWAVQYPTSPKRSGRVSVRFALDVETSGVPLYQDVVLTLRRREVWGSTSPGYYSDEFADENIQTWYLG